MSGRGVGRDEIHEAAWGESYPHPFISCLMPVIAVLAVAAVVIFGFQLWEWSLPRQVLVPVVIGLKQEDATAQMRTVGLRPVVMPYQQASETIPAGLVISTAPAGGRHVRAGRVVNLVVSSGSAYTKVPDIRELGTTEAQTRLQQANLTVASEIYVYNDKIPADRVLAVTPAPGMRLKRASTVALKISKGPKPSEGMDAPELDTHVSTISVVLPTDQGDQPDMVRIDVIDDNGRTTVYEHEHAPGDTVTYTAKGVGDTTVEVYFGSVLILTRTL